MSKLHSVGRANKGLFGSLRLFGLASVVAVAGLLTAPAIAQTCEFDDPTAAADGNGGWKEDSGSFGIEYLLGGTNDTTALPTVSATNAARLCRRGRLVLQVVHGRWHDSTHSSGRRRDDDVRLADAGRRHADS